MSDELFSLKYHKIKKVLCFTLSLALLSMLFLSIPQSFAADPIAGTSTGANGRILPASVAGDTSDWVEIAQNGEYSLIVRKNYINIYAGSGHNGDPTWQYCPYSSPLVNNYLNSGCRVRNAINNWFNGRATGVADNLSTSATLRSYTVQNNAANTLGTCNTIASMTNGLSKPTTNQVRTGDDVAFALSYSEAAEFLSKTHDIRGANPQVQPSNTNAINNFNKIAIPQIYGYGMWLRSPGDLSYTAGELDYTGRVFQGQIDPSSNNERYLVYPALWVHSSIFPSPDVGYKVHYYLAGTTQSVAPDKIGSGKVGSYVTEYAINIPGYTAVAPTSVSQILVASGTEFVFYYTVASCDTTYTVHYYLAGTTASVASDKVGSGQVGSWVTENAIAVAGYTAVAPTSVSQILVASGTEFVFYYTANPGDDDVPIVVDGRTLTPNMTGDKVNWIEIARYGDYSLIVRTNYINIYPQAAYYGNPEWQYTSYGSTNTYGTSVVRDKINNWFNGLASPVADNLSANARLREFTLQNNALSATGTASTVPSLTNGFSKPTSNQVGTGNDVSFALSYSEAAEFLSKTHDVRGMNPQVQPSNTNATINFNKITIPQIYAYGLWLRSPGDISYTAGDLDYTGRAFQFQINPNGNNERGLVYPALWVKSSIFETSYTVHYYLAGSTVSVAADKVVSGQIGSSVTEYAVDVAGYTAVVPTSVTKTLDVSDNVINFYYTARTDLSYVVNYLELGSNNVLAGQKVVGGQTFGAFVTEYAIDIAGYNKVDPTSVTFSIAVDGNVVNFYYTTNDDSGTIGSIRKTVDGIAFAVWVAGYGGDVFELVSGISFKLYMVNADGTINYDVVVANGVLNADSGLIVFDVSVLSAGQYVVLEYLSGSAAVTFEVVDPLYIWIGADGKMVAVTEFDSDAFYWSTDAFYNSQGTANLMVHYVLNWSSEVLQNPWFNDFQTRQYDLVSGSYGRSYSSFCGYYASGKLGGDTYNGPSVVYLDVSADFAALKPGVKENLVAAYNYIYDTWGSLDQWPSATGTSSAGESTKFIAQIVTWLLLEDGVVEAYSDFAYINDCVDQVLANYLGYSGSKTIKDIVFLAAEGYPNNLDICQPQVVPIYGEPEFNNQLKTVDDTSAFSLRKTVGGIAFDLWVAEYTDAEIAELVSGISFKLYMVNADGTINYDVVVANGVLNAGSGMIDFNLPPLLDAGRYAIVESLSGRAALVFAAVSPLFISISEDGVVFEDFDFAAQYFVCWSWFNADGRVGLAGVPVGDYYITEVWNIETRTSLGADYKSYASFCADGASRTFAEAECYVVGQLDQETYESILDALNYINNKYGSVDAWQGNVGPFTVEQSTRVLSQMVIWTLIHHDDSVALQGLCVAEAGYDTADFAFALQDVLANSAGSSGAIKALVYLVGSNFPNDIISCQPQIIPLFGELVFDNKALQPSECGLCLITTS
jgi:hypothetical protein